MIVEIIGCTGAGKSTLATQLLRYHGSKQQWLTSQDIILQKLHLTWLPGTVLRKLAVNTLGVLVFLLRWQQHATMVSLYRQVLSHRSAVITRREKFRVFRLMARNLGVYAFVKRHQAEHQIVLCDEGTLHIAHYLFVSTTFEPDMSQLDLFTRLVPLPDQVIILNADKTLLLTRTLERGHKRIATGALAKRFVEHALTTFQVLSSHQRVKPLLLAVDAGALSRNGAQALEQVSKALLKPGSADCATPPSAVF